MYNKCRNVFGLFTTHGHMFGSCVRVYCIAKIGWEALVHIYNIYFQCSRSLTLFPRAYMRLSRYGIFVIFTFMLFFFVAKRQVKLAPPFQVGSFSF